ncbi:type II secretion system GspH family protein, partial [Patescibacteria group bacterium]|nr:type II secretion system GspH family protein [Patescibacteria group bacterium]
MNKGFTLLEVLITLSIFVIVASLILANYPEFQAGISLKRTSQEIALTIREAQSYSLSVKGFQDEYKGYGVYFEKFNSNSYILFSDL